MPRREGWKKRAEYVEAELAREKADRLVVISDRVEGLKERAIRVMEEARGTERKWEKEQEQ